MLRENQTKYNKKPTWVSEVNQILNDQFLDNLTLEYLSKTLDIHPVHLSRDFSKYFNSNLGEYIRKLKVQKSLQLITEKGQDLTSIAFECGFSDQSHFTRCFKEVNGINPSEYRRILFI
jgi:AraC-like DNA-binding protein